MNETLREFEDEKELTATEASKLLGVSYSTYMAYRNNGRPLPKYIRFSVEVLRLLDQKSLDRRIRKVVYGGSPETTG